MAGGRSGAMADIQELLKEMLPRPRFPFYFPIWTLVALLLSCTPRFWLIGVEVWEVGYQIATKLGLQVKKSLWGRYLGKIDYLSNEIEVEALLPPLLQAGVLFHELGHFFLHRSCTFSHVDEEAEAYVFSYMCLAPYLPPWAQKVFMKAQGEAILEVALQAGGNVIVYRGHSLLEAVESINGQACPRAWQKEG